MRAGEGYRWYDAPIDDPQFESEDDYEQSPAWHFLVIGIGSACALFIGLTMLDWMLDTLL